MSVQELVCFCFHLDFYSENIVTLLASFHGYVVSGEHQKRAFIFFPVFLGRSVEMKYKWFKNDNNKTFPSLACDWESIDEITN